MQRSPEFTTTYRHHWRYVLSALRKRGVDQRELEDAAQEVFLTLFRRAPVCEGEVMLRAWLCKVIVNVARNRVRSRRRREPLWLAAPESSELGLVPDAAAAEPEALALLRERFLNACRAIRRLRPKQRQVLILRYFDEMSALQIARATGSPPATVATRLRAACLAVRAAT